MLRNGAPVARLDGPSPVSIATPRQACSVVRVVASGGYSAPLYAS